MDLDKDEPHTMVMKVRWRDAKPSLVEFDMDKPGDGATVRREILKHMVITDTGHTSTFIFVDRLRDGETRKALSDSALLELSLEVVPSLLVVQDLDDATARQLTGESLERAISQALSDRDEVEESSPCDTSGTTNTSDDEDAEEVESGSGHGPGDRGKNTNTVTGPRDPSPPPTPPNPPQK